MGYIGVTGRELIYRSDDFKAWEILVIFRYSEELGGLIGLYVKKCLGDFGGVGVLCFDCWEILKLTAWGLQSVAREVKIISPCTRFTRMARYMPFAG